MFFADTYAFLINHDVSHERVAYRTRYYQLLIPAILDSLKIPRSKIEYVTESESFTFNPAYIKKEQQIWALASRDAVGECGNDIDATKILSPMVCPVRQALDEAFLNVHFQLGGEDQVDIISPLNFKSVRWTNYIEKNSVGCSTLRTNSCHKWA